MPPAMSNTLTLGNVRAIVYGSPGVGKTFSAVTLSEHCPADFSHIRVKTPIKRAQAVTLKDTVWVSFDAGATTGFEEQGIIVPEYPLANVPPLELQKKLDEVAKELGESVRAGITKLIVIDTLSAFNEMLLYRQQSINNLDKFNLYAAVLADHKRFLGPFKALQCHILVHAHARAMMETDDVNALRRIKAAGGGTIHADVTGQSLNLYRRDATFILPVMRQVRLVPDPAAPGKNLSVDGHWFYTKHADFECKTKIQLPEVIPADWRQVMKAAAVAPQVKAVEEQA